MNFLKTSLLLFCFFGLATTTVQGQKAKTHVLTTDEAKIVKKDAATLYGSADYHAALPAYLELYKTDQNNTEYNYRIGYCYVQTLVNKKEALKYLARAIQSKEAKKDWYYPLGQAYMYNNQWDEAIAAFTEFNNSKAKLPKENTPTDRMIEMCNNGKELTAKPVNCKFVNMGKSINSIYDEYNPIVSADGKTLVYTSRRKGNIGGFIEDLGIFTSDIYWVVWKDTIWSKTKGLGGLVNSEWDEESVGLSPVGDQIMIYFDNTEAFADLGVSNLKGKMWQKPVMFGTEVNSKNYEGAATQSLDGNTILFSCNKKEGVGGSDLYMIKKGKNGEWSAPLSLGSNINTKYDEDFPMLSMDGQTLYFSSKGWNSMGGFDIFKSELNTSTGTWGSPINIGFPLNDADDNTFISLTGDGKFGYMALARPGGMGERDIYRVEFPDESHHKFSKILTGNVSSNGSGKIEITKVTLTEKSTNKIIEFKPAGGLNNFVFPVHAGEYSIKAEGYNFTASSEDVTVDGTMEQTEVVKNISVKAGK